MVSQIGNPWVTANAPNAIPSGRYPIPTGPVSRAACFMADHFGEAGGCGCPGGCRSGGLVFVSMEIMLGISVLDMPGVLNPGNGYRSEILPPELMFCQSRAASLEVLSNLGIKELVTGCTRIVFAANLAVR